MVYSCQGMAWQVSIAVQNLAPQRPKRRPSVVLSWQLTGPSIGSERLPLLIFSCQSMLGKKTLQCNAWQLLASGGAPLLHRPPFLIERGAT